MFNNLKALVRARVGELDELQKGLEWEAISSNLQEMEAIIREADVLSDAYEDASIETIAQLDKEINDCLVSTKNHISTKTKVMMIFL